MNKPHLSVFFTAVIRFAMESHSPLMETWRRYGLLCFFVGLSLTTAAAVEREVPDSATSGPADHAEDTVEFSREIRPLLANACYHCHGPDEENREAGLRLDSFEAATGGAGDYAAITPGDAEDSDVMLRMRSDDEDAVMPPHGSGKSLSPDEIDLIARWIDQGAKYEDHWAFDPPTEPVLPESEVAQAFQEAGVKTNEVDAFILARLADEGRLPSLLADRSTLIRRLSLDLIGLPPTPEEVDAFVSDDSDDAYDRLVERLLASPHYGERWARLWLDAARYADSDGFEKDKPRFVHFYRDWVVKALSNDMPYDQFVIRQIAGDLLDQPTQDDLVATGFLRNSMINEEGGADPEQFRMESIYDRMDAIGKSVLGLTVHCAQCHSHKYDPISHTDYYRLFAMLNNCHESCITVYTDQEREARDEALAQLAEIRKRFLHDEPEAGDDFQSWLDESRLNQTQLQDQTWIPLDLDFIENTTSGQKFLAHDDGSYLGQGYAPTKTHPEGDAIVDLQRVTAVKLDVMCDPTLPHGGPGRSLDGTWALSEITLSYSFDSGETWTKAKFDQAFGTIAPEESPLHPRYHEKAPDPKRITGPVSMAIDGDKKTAWTGVIGPGRRNDPQTGWFLLAEPIERPIEQTIEQTIKQTIKQTKNDTPTTDDTLENERLPSKLWLRVGLEQRHGGWNSDENQSQALGRFRISVSGTPCQPDQLRKGLPPLLAAKILGDGLTDSDRNSFLDHFIDSSDSYGDWKKKRDAAWLGYPQGTSQLIVTEQSTPRSTHRLERGDFLSPREEVTPGVPSFLHEMPSTGQRTPNRMDLAKWLVDKKSPTTARTIANRIWQAYFGTGLTATSDDLGLQGEPPTHPELIDWLAVDLMEKQWSLKSLHRNIVHSRTYRQSSNISSEQFADDPANRLLARGPRFRVPAEMVRDIALTASGLLNHEVGGRPVFPPAPSFLFQPPSSYGPKTWTYETDNQKYRRGFYTFRFRSIPYPAFQAFDAPTGEVSCVRRGLSNTPLQALVTLNEPLFLECAQHLAGLTLDADLNTDQQRLEFIYKRCVSRIPTEDERGILQAMLAKQRRRMANERELAFALSASSDDANRYEANERAAWTAVCRVVLNLDETITKP